MKEVQILDSEGDKLVIGFRAKGGVEQNLNWYNMMVKLAYIQEKTNHRIPAPSIITKEDANAIQHMSETLNTGEEKNIIDNISIKVDKKGALQLIDISEKEGKISNVGLSEESTYRSILKEEILLGPSNIKLPDMKLKQPIKSIKKLIAATPETGSNQTLILCPSWMKKDHSKIRKLASQIILSFALIELIVFTRKITGDLFSSLCYLFAFSV